MVGASVDAVDVINILDRRGDSVPYLGSNLPAVYLESGKLTSKTSSVNPYNQNIVVSGNSIALAGPDYENGQYQNGTAKDYTVHFVPGTTASKDDAAAELSSLPVNTQFKVRVSAVAGSKLFFGSHQTERVFTVSATDLSDFGKKTTGYRAGRLTVSDTAVAEPYVVSNGSEVSAAAISYEYTGSTITPKLSVTFTPVTPDSSKFNGTFAPINLLSYATVAPATIPADVKKNQNFTLTANTGSGFSGTLTIPYEVTQKTITQEMIGWSGTPSAVYDGKSKKATIEGMIQVTDNGKTVSAGDYSYTLCDATGTAIAITADGSAFTNVGKIYVKVTGTNNYSGSAIGVTPFEITAKSVNNVSISLDGQDETKDRYIKYTGSSVAQPKVEVSDGTKPLTGRWDWTRVTVCSVRSDSAVMLVALLPMAGTRRDLRRPRAESREAKSTPSSEKLESRQSGTWGVPKPSSRTASASIEVSTQLSTASASAPKRPRARFTALLVTTSRLSSMMPSCRPRHMAEATFAVLSIPLTGKPSVIYARITISTIPI